MTPAAPRFLVPQELIVELLRNLDLTSDSASTAVPKVEVGESSGDEFLDLLRRAMPPGESSGDGFLDSVRRATPPGESSGDEFLDSVRRATPPGESSGDEFLDLVRRAMPPGGIGGAPDADMDDADTDEEDDLLGPRMGLTENQSATYLSSGDPCLDFFFQVVPSTPEDTVGSLLERAWKKDPLTALKLLFHLRGVRGTGKSDKKGFYGAALWLYKHHPATLVENLPMVAGFGYFKDLLELLLRLVEGPRETSKKAEAKTQHKAVVTRGKSNAKLWAKIKQEKEKLKKRRSSEMAVEGDEESDDEFVHVRRHAKPDSKGYYARKGAAARAAAEAGTLKPREDRVAASLAKDRAASEQAAVARKDKKLDLARRIARIYAHDLKFQTLYSKVADVLAAQLKVDLEALHEGRLFDLSLAGKWAPSLDKSYDLRTLLCYAIATRIFPKEDLPEYEGMNNSQYGSAVRDRLRKEVLVPLRKVLDLPEVYMSAQRWGEVNYKRVASVAMSNYKDLFLEHDEERFNEYLGAVKKGEQKVAAGALLPHDIARAAVHENGQSAEVAELQWKRMVDDLREHGKLTNCIAVCDVSGSMSGTPMEVCIALGILLSELSEKPWKGNVITFSAEPEIHLAQGESLKEKYKFVEMMNWDMNTNLQKVFDKLLKLARREKLAPEKMIKRVFIFSDMEFDAASQTPWETDYTAISRKFEKAGYGTPPEIIFWNLRDSGSIPVTKSQGGVALVSGFSKNILKIFLEEGGPINPIKAMHTAIAGEEYSKLIVVD